MNGKQFQDSGPFSSSIEIESGEFIINEFNLRRFYAVNRSNGNVIDSTNAIPFENHGLTYAPPTNELIFADRDSGRIRVFDFDTFAENQNWTASNCLSVHYDQSSGDLFATVGYNVFRYDGISSTVLGSFSTSEFPHGVTMDENENIITSGWDTGDFHKYNGFSATRLYTISTGRSRLEDCTYDIQNNRVIGVTQDGDDIIEFNDSSAGTQISSIPAPTNNRSYGIYLFQ